MEIYNLFKGPDGRNFEDSAVFPRKLEVLEKHLGGYAPKGSAAGWVPNLWTWIIKELNVKSVLDVGCGGGAHIKFFKEKGCEVLGIEGSSKAIFESVVPENVVKHDFCNGPYKPNKKYDLVWSCEFVEHVEEKYKQNFLETFKFSNKYLFLTHAVPGQGGHHHVNEQLQSYWINDLSKIGFKLLPRLTLTAREKAGHGWFLKTGLVFIKKNN